MAARDKDFDGLSNELVAAVAKENFGLRVNDDDFPFGADDHHAIGRRIEQRSDVRGPIGMVALEVGRKSPQQTHRFALFSPS